MKVPFLSTDLNPVHVSVAVVILEHLEVELSRVGSARREGEMKWWYMRHKRAGVRHRGA